MTDEMIGRYRLRRLLGVGGFAAVHEAYDEALDTLVAVKVLADNHSLDPESRARFIDEGRLLRRVDHPNIVTVHDIGETPNHQPYLVLQHADRGSLADRLVERGEQVTRTDVAQLADALEAALGALHAEGIVHRDLSPDNVFIAAGSPTIDDRRVGEHGLFDGGETLLLGDLGLAKDLARSSGMTVGAGTGQYAAPEQLDPFGQVGPAADIYGASALLRRVVRGTDLASAVERGTTRSIAADPADRPASMAEWRRAIDGSLDRAPASPTRRSRWWIALAGLGALAIAAFIVWPRSDSRQVSNELPAAIVIYDGEIGLGWTDASWGRPDTLTDAGQTRLAEFGALSFAAAEPVPVDARQWLTFVVAGLDQQARLQLRANDGAGDALAPCLVSGADFVRPSDEGTMITLPVTLLSLPADELSRVSLIEAAGDELSFVTLRVEIAAAPAPPPAAVTCG